MPESAKGCRQRLLARLRSRPEQDPFQGLVTGSETRPDQLPGYQAGLYAAELNLLRGVCETYRPPDGPQPSEIDLPRSGVVVTLGVRGAGKTTLFHRLRGELPDALIVRPTHYRPDLPFPQYILHEFVFELNRRSQRPEGDLVATMADRLAGKVVYELLAGLTDVEWVREYGKWSLATKATRWFMEAVRLWGFFTRARVERRHRLREAIAQQGHAIRPLLRRYPYYADDLQRLALDHVHQREGTTDLEGAIRAGLYKRLVQLAFAPHTALPEEKAREELVSYLLEGYTREYSGGVVYAPELAVTALLRCLVGLLVLHRIPPIVAFDSFDTIRMFGNPVDVTRFGAFYNGLGDFLDHYGGIGFLLFAEIGYWNAALAGGLQDNYAAQRINQGVSNVLGRGTVTTVHLPSPSVGMIRSLVEVRLAPLHHDLRAMVPECAAMVDDLFPLSATILETGPDSETASIRLRLLKARDEYIAALEQEAGTAPLATASAPSPPPLIPPSPQPPQPPPLLQPRQIWDSIYAEMDREVEPNMSGQANSLQGALSAWLGLLMPCCMPWTASQVETKSVGTTPYEQFTLCTWRDDTQAHVSAVGFLLGYGPGLANDLKKKFAALEKMKAQFHSALLLFPTGKYPEEYLPPGAQTVWNQARKSTVHLRPIPRDAVVTWLTVAEWRDQNGDGSADEIEFLRFKTQHLFEFIAPQP